MTNALSKFYKIVVDKREQRLIDYDKAHPEVGMGPFPGMLRRDAIYQLKIEGKIPGDYEDFD